MTDADLSLLEALLTRNRILTLAVLVDGLPHASVLPFALLPDGSGAIVQASRLAAHTRGLTAGAPFSVAIHDPLGTDDDPMQVKRVTLDGHVRVLERETADFDRAEATLSARVPGAAFTLSMGDFGLYELRFERGRLVGGFARASNVTAEALAALAGRLAERPGDRAV